MKKLVSVAIILALLISVAASSGCGRQPSQKKTTAIMEKFFKKYSKKYPESILGQYHVKNVQLLHVEEIHKNLVVAYAFLELDGGMAVQTRFTIQKKPPFGWRALSWENMGLAMEKPTESSQGK